MTNYEIGNRIKSERERQKLTLRDIADKIGVAASTIQRYEAGSINNIKLPVIEAIASKLKVNPLWLMGKSDTKEPHFKENIQSSAHSNLNEKDEKDIAKIIQKMKTQLMTETDLMFDGEAMTPETIELLLQEIEQQERIVKAVNKKYIPKKYR